jgi:formylmethanofuran dehydrogenase subunit D
VTISISPAKAKELSVSDGDAVVLVGRRRKAAYALVKVEKTKKGVCTVSQNMAKNLRLRDGDKLKVIPMGSEEDQPRSGDMVLLKHDKPPKVTSVTFSPIEDSLAALEAREGGDTLPDEELMERFVTPYLNLSEKSAVVKKNSMLTLVDDNGKKLDFMVTHVELEDASEATKADSDEGKDV